MIVVLSLFYPAQSPVASHLQMTGYRTGKRHEGMTGNHDNDICRMASDWWVISSATIWQQYESLADHHFNALSSWWGNMLAMLATWCSTKPTSMLGKHGKRLSWLLYFKTTEIKGNVWHCVTINSFCLFGAFLKGSNKCGKNIIKLWQSSALSDQEIKEK